MYMDSDTPRVLFVDDEHAILKAMKRLTISEGWETYFADSAEEGLAIIERQAIDIVISDMRMPGMSGSDFLVHVKNHFPDTQRVLMTGYSDVTALEKVVNEAGIFNYVSKPWDDNVFKNVINNAITFQVSERNRRRHEQQTLKKNQKLGKLALCLKGRVQEKDIEVQQALSLLELEHKLAKDRTKSLLSALSRLINFSGKCRNHTKFIIDTSTQLARQFNLDESEVENLILASYLHNIGSLALPSDRLNLPQFEMTRQELERHQTEVELGATILSGLGELAEVCDIVRKHKEHLDGSGYPNQLHAEEIPISARIMCVVTEYVLLRLGLKIENVRGHAESRDYMYEHARRFYDADIVQSFFDMVDADTQIEYSTIISSRQSELVPGMVLAEDLLSQHGALLLNTGTVLDHSHIQNLYSYEKSTGQILVIHVCRDTGGNIQYERRGIHCTQ